MIQWSYYALIWDSTSSGQWSWSRVRFIRTAGQPCVLMIFFGVGSLLGIFHYEAQFYRCYKDKSVTGKSGTFHISFPSLFIETKMTI